MFRKQDAINWQHLLVAGVIALLIVASQGLSLLQQLWPDAQPLYASSRVIVNELLNLFSSTILMLTAWEACRGYAQTQGAERRHRQLFLATFVAAVTLCAIIAKIWLPAQGAALQMEVLSAGAALAILVMTQWLIRQRFAAPTTDSAGAAEPEAQPQALANSVPQALQTQLPVQPTLPTETRSAATGTTALSQADLALFAQLQQLLFNEKLYLQANLRLTDVAQLLQVPEYRVSRLIRSQFHASNFNHFINTFRIEHAKSLLTDPAKQHWPVLVVGLESGFASVGPFTRAFKTQTGDTPNEYRLKQREPVNMADWVHS
jgi:AraC-like DNA-binding protein